MISFGSLEYGYLEIVFRVIHWHALSVNRHGIKEEKNWTLKSVDHVCTVAPKVHRLLSRENGLKNLIFQASPYFDTVVDRIDFEVASMD